MDFAPLKRTASGVGKPEWVPMLEYVADLHGRSVFPARGFLPYEWENIGPGYCYGPAFGHWDLFHAVLDSMPVLPEHARRQILNVLATQRADGILPALVWMRDPEPKVHDRCGHPPVWIYAVDEYCALLASDELRLIALPHLLRQIEWFEANRRAEPDGFFYLDILNPIWESGFDEGIRYLEAQDTPRACVDACSQVYALYDCAARWLGKAGRDGSAMEAKASRLKTFIQEELFSEETGFYHDIWSVHDPAKQHFCFEGFWPMISGAATQAQAGRLIEESVLNRDRFLTQHPVPTVAVCDPLHELRMMRGPAWNSMTYWLARGCRRYGRPGAAATVLGMALDATAAQFARTGTVWEFYHPSGGRQEDVQRKPSTPFNVPCREYLGHNPLFAMARLWKQCVEAREAGQAEPRKEGA